MTPSTSTSIPTTTNQIVRANCPGPLLPKTSIADIASQPPREVAEDKVDINIEHVPVDDDPRSWGRLRKARRHFQNFYTHTVDDDYLTIGGNAVDYFRGDFDRISCVGYTKSYVKSSQSPIE